MDQDIVDDTVIQELVTLPIEDVYDMCTQTNDMNIQRICMNNNIWDYRLRRDYGIQNEGNAMDTYFSIIQTQLLGVYINNAFMKTLQKSGDNLNSINASVLTLIANDRINLQSSLFVYTDATFYPLAVGLYPSTNIMLSLRFPDSINIEQIRYCIILDNARVYTSFNDDITRLYKQVSRFLMIQPRQLYTISPYKWENISSANDPVVLIDTQDVEETLQLTSERLFNVINGLA